ncbi:MAG: diguanylate cyclase, partial [Candidatus Eremiobacteraeota bacterium]|nr:diguanylate cyclase [Candidatus Eremiobacteraeota bacterium]
MIKTVLFVDDDAAVRRVFRKMALRLGYQVELAASGVEAITLVRAQNFPVIVTDLRMPGLDGLALLECIRGLSPGSITMLATGAPELELPCPDANDCSLAAILRKPLSYEDLADALERAFALHSSEVEGEAECGENRILLVEDDAIDARLTVARLSKDLPAASVTVVARLDEAEGYLDRHKVGTILTDLTLPDGRGVDAVSRLRTAQPDAAIVVLSGSQSEKMAVATLKRGAQDYILKDLADGPTLKRSIRYALERKRSERRLLRLAYHDPVTGLPNRQLFQDRLVQGLARARREHNDLVVVFIDLDRFKAVNDSLGHEAGDRLLKVIADRLSTALRDTDTVARLGGDEFGALLEGANQREVTRLCQRLLAAVREPVMLGSETVSVGASLGAAAFPEHGFTADGLLKAADSAMYKSKR